MCVYMYVCVVMISAGEEGFVGVGMYACMHVCMCVYMYWYYWNVCMCVYVCVVMIAEGEGRIC